MMIARVLDRASWRHRQAEIAKPVMSSKAASLVQRSSAAGAELMTNSCSSLRDDQTVFIENAARYTNDLPVINVACGAWIVNGNCHSVISLRILLGTGR
jgi:biotin carboxylase